MAAPRTHAKPAFLTGRPRIQPQTIVGRHARVRWAVMAVKLAIFLALPWIRIGDAPALRFDVVARRIDAFGLVFWPQDLYMAGLLLALMAMLLFVTTTLVGRVFCGYACPHTLLVTLFMAIDRAIEGDRPARLALDGGRGVRWRRWAKHAVWLAVAAALGATFGSYFTGPTALALGVFTAGLTYLFAGHLRDFICTTTCPYGRFQGAMGDTGTRVVTYDVGRGEPRGKGASTIARGGCVDCGQCVAVCPMGIDIRKGLQYECITCMRCVDACDATFAKLGMPAPSLIGLAAAKPRRNRARLAWYGLVITGLVGALATLVATRPLYILTASRDRATAIAMPGGEAANLYVLTVRNKDTRPHEVAVVLDGGGRLVAGTTRVTLAPGEARALRASVVMPARPGAAPTPFTFRLVDPVAGRGLAEAAASFVPPT